MYDPSTKEPKWQKKWEEAGVYTTDLSTAKDKYYSMVMFPYPSGDKLHVGHWYNFAPADSYSRFMRLQGKKVFSAIGFDAFGLPAENYAIKKGVHPSISIAENTLTMINQLKRIGCMYDWEKALNTSIPEYYQWTQWLFLQMYKNNLAFKKQGNVNWCSSCMTVLANEQAQDGTCERCGTEIIQKPMTQWYWRITDYADRLLDDLEDLDWPEKTKTMQRNWIGRKSGINITYNIVGTKRGFIGRINSPEGSEDLLAADVNRQLTDPRQGRIHSARTVHLTFTPHMRQSFFEKPEHATAILRIIDEVAFSHDIVIHEATAMPDHVHLLVSFDEQRHLEKDITKKLKRASSRLFRKSYSFVDKALWGQKKHFEDVTSDDQFTSVLQYIQQNPKEARIDELGRILSALPRTLTCFTTRPDTNFGATFVVLAPEHPFIQQIVRGEVQSEEQGRVEKYVSISLGKSELERQGEGRKKTGAFTGHYALNALNNKKMPIWVSDFVLAGFGTGAVVGVPGHDLRDFEFAQQFDITITRVVVGPDGDTSAITTAEQVQEEEGTMMNSDYLNGMQIMDAKEVIMEKMEKSGWGKRVTSYRIRDWSIGRQRYWGAPIPIVYDPEGKPHPISEQHLPWVLPVDVDFKATGTPPLARSKELLERTEKVFGKGWTPEVETMDAFVCSSFYQFRYLAEGNSKEFVPKKLEKNWMPVDMYIGGPEHACMHLIYARFVTKALHDFGFISVDEPFQRLVHQGIITNQGAKMSKSKGNVVSPDSFIEKYGSDVFRMYLMFMGPFTEGGDWSDTGIKGVDRFVQRIWKVFGGTVDEEDSNEVTVKLHATIKKVTQDIERLHFNTALSALMELVNMVEKQKSVSRELAQTFAILVSPMAPHLAEELWEHLGGKGFICNQSWPAFDEAQLVTDTITIAVQINGRVRAELQMPSNVTESVAIELAKGHENVQKYLEGKEIKKEIYVVGKLVSLVVA
jgi:leucyl-tRNA synthetase